MHGVVFSVHTYFMYIKYVDNKLCVVNVKLMFDNA